MVDGVDASANLWNSRFALIVNEINGNLDTSNLKDAAVTTAKIAPGAVTSDKLGFTKYTDANGWLITDLGLIKLATKKRTFVIPATPLAALAQLVTFDTDMSNSPVGFDSNQAFSVNYSLSLNTNEIAYSYMFNAQENTGVLYPGFSLVARNITGVARGAGDVGAATTWVVF